MADETMFFRNGKIYRHKKPSQIEKREEDAANSWHRVASTNVVAIRWRPGTGLSVHFGGVGKKDVQYNYPAAPRSIFTRMLSASSKGRFMQEVVIPAFPHVGPLSVEE